MDTVNTSERDLPRFAELDPVGATSAVERLLADVKQETKDLLQTDSPSWGATLQPIEDLDDKLNRAWSPVSHLHNVADSDALRKAYNECLPKLTAWNTEKYQNDSLYQAVRKVHDGSEYRQLGAAERKIVDNALRDFRLSGVELPSAQRERFKEIRQELSRLQTKYEENLLDATQAWKKHVTRVEDLEGLPASALALAEQTASHNNVDGWMLTLDFPSYRPVMMYCGNRAMREEMYIAYLTRASEIGPNAGEYDNTVVMNDILRLRFELARMLGFNNYAEYSLATKMARSTQQVLSFLNDLAQRSRPIALREMQELRDFARDKYGVMELQPWDIGYYSERLRETRYSISQEELRPYFPLPQVLTGLFGIVKRLYGLQITCGEAQVWHPDVSFYNIHDAAGELRGRFYLDLYARQQKRGGAWMDDCVSRRRREDGSIQTPVAYLNCNFTPPVGTDPALLTHDEVLTLFHEFGHGLHHMLTRVERPSVSGINGVVWDAVELPSQFMENWCWEKEGLALLAKHYKSGAPLEDGMIDKLRAARNFQSGMQMVRQLEFALFDFCLHMEYAPQEGRTVESIARKVRDAVAVVPIAEFNRFQHSFSHIFAGGYSAGYYSYKWAEVLSADAYSKFEERGIFDARTGREFLESILEAGGAYDAMELFVRFRGREPTVDALLRHSGIG